MLRYIPRTIFPVSICFTMSEKSFLKEMKRLKVDLNHVGPWLKEGCSATVTELVHEKHGSIFFVTLDPKDAKEATHNQVAAMLAHETVHVVDWIFEHVGENKPGMETRAYLTQFILQNLLYLYDEMTKKGRKK